MHYVEHLRSKDFYAGSGSDQVRLLMQQNLERCISLDTFAYAMARSLPWIFAEDAAERDLVKSQYASCQRQLTPPFCIWIAHQLSFLALFRRAYARTLLGYKIEAFNDYLKVQRLMRIATRTLSIAATRVPGSMQFTAGLDALAEYHIGELYRSDHAHTRAFDHYDRAFDRLELLARQEEMKSVLNGSRWRIQLLVSKGKAFYELGQVKQSLEWYARAWREFLTVAARDAQMELNASAADALISWLFQIRNDPDVSKGQLVRNLRPFADELGTVRVSKRLNGLASDILNRIGHVILVLRLVNDPQSGTPDQADETLHELAYKCLSLAASYDEHSTLAHSNVLMASYQNPEIAKASEALRFQPTRQWPRGGGDFERFARVYEHVLLESVGAAGSASQIDPVERWMAVDLIVRFLTHTDNINVKLSQLYQYLTEPRQRRPISTHFSLPAIEFVCLRRYSSFFPFLPRPSAFRVLGGGYFIRVHSSDAPPFGIVIDPGADFIENLYRCGFALADIDMIVATHDHADHLASLDPLLSLLEYRAQVAGSDFNLSRKLLILGNESVVKRYEFYNQQPRNPIGIRRLDLPIADAGFAIPPKGILNIKAMPTGHMDAGGHEALALHLSVAGGGSIAITSDAARTTDWSSFQDADVFVVHLSSAPFSELRRLARLEVRNPMLEKLWEGIEQSDSNLARRVRFAFWDQGRIGKDRGSAGLFGAIPTDFRPPSNHLYLEKVVEIAKSFNAGRNGRRGLFVVSELREELGTFRTKIAAGLTKRVFRDKGPARAVTADVGLRVVVDKDGPRVLCSTCETDNDRTMEERYHAPKNIWEVCVKGENEAVFYNCGTHDPSHLEDPVFVERMERYDIFGRGTLR